MTSLSPVKRRIGPKHNVVIPMHYIKNWQLSPYEYVVFEPHAEGVLLKPVKNAITEGFGFLPQKISAQEIKNTIRKEEEIRDAKKFHGL